MYEITLILISREYHIQQSALMVLSLGVLETFRNFAEKWVLIVAQLIFTIFGTMASVCQINTISIAMISIPMVFMFATAYRLFLVGCFFIANYNNGKRRFRFYYGHYFINYLSFKKNKVTKIKLNKKQITKLIKSFKKLYQYLGV